MSVSLSVWSAVPGATVLGNYFTRKAAALDIVHKLIVNIGQKCMAKGKFISYLVSTDTLTFMRIPADAPFFSAAFSLRRRSSSALSSSPDIVFFGGCLS